MTRARPLVGTAAVLLTLGAGGCGGGDDAGTVEGPRLHPLDDDATALVAGASEGGSDARLAGSLAVGRGGCLGVDVGGRVVLVAFAGKTVSTSSAFTVRLGDEDHGIGDRVELAGGSVSLPYPDRVPEPPAACVAEDQEIFVVD